MIEIFHGLLGPGLEFSWTVRQNIILFNILPLLHMMMLYFKCEMNPIIWDKFDPEDVDSVLMTMSLAICVLLSWPSC